MDKWGEEGCPAPTRGQIGGTYTMTCDNITIKLKKDGLDADVYGNYRPISNLHTISKIVERVFFDETCLTR